MHARPEFFGKHGVHAALPLDAAQTGKGRRHDRNTEMGFALRARACMARMTVGLVLDDK